jgi:hypothetical protein
MTRLALKGLLLGSAPLALLCVGSIGFASSFGFICVRDGRNLRAFHEWITNPSPETEAAWRHESGRVAHEATAVRALGAALGVACLVGSFAVGRRARGMW